MCRLVISGQNAHENLNDQSVVNCADLSCDTLKSRRARNTTNVTSLPTTHMTSQPSATVDECSTIAAPPPPALSSSKRPTKRVSFQNNIAHDSEGNWDRVLGDCKTGRISRSGHQKPGQLIQESEKWIQEPGKSIPGICGLQNLLTSRDNSNVPNQSSLDGIGWKRSDSLESSVEFGGLVISTEGEGSLPPVNTSTVTEERLKHITVRQEKFFQIPSETLAANEYLGGGSSSDVTIDTLTSHNVKSNNVTSKTVTSNIVTSNNGSTDSVKSRTVPPSNIGTLHNVTSNTVTSHNVTLKTVKSDTVSTINTVTSDRLERTCEEVGGKSSNYPSTDKPIDALQTYDRHAHKQCKNAFFDFDRVNNNSHNKNSNNKEQKAVDSVAAPRGYSSTRAHRRKDSLCALDFRNLISSPRCAAYIIEA